MPPSRILGSSQQKTRILRYLVIPALLLPLLYILTKTRDDHAFSAPKPGNQVLYNISMIWTTPPESFTRFHQMVVERTLYFNPNAHLHIYSLSLPDNFFKDFTKRGYRVTIERFGMQDYVGTPLEAWADKTRLFEKPLQRERGDSPIGYSHLSDSLRPIALKKHGGVYIDFDIITLKSFEPLLHAGMVGFQYEQGSINTANNNVNGAVQIFDPNHPFLDLLMRTETETYDPEVWTSMGPQPVTLASTRIEWIYFPDPFDPKELLQRVPKDHLAITGTWAFYPLNPDQCRALSDPKQTETLRPLIRESYLIHYWGRQTLGAKNVKYAKGSLMHEFFQEGRVLPRDMSTLR